MNLTATNKKQLDREAIKAMAGCFEVTFNFIETFNYSKESEYKPSKKKREKALEVALLIEDGENKISLQHLLVVGPPSKPHIVKHWRQDWLYENTDFYFYDGDNNWKFHQKSFNEVQGQWTQKVFQVDDSPRYEGSATWIHIDGKVFWENTTPAPLPRREHTQRSDYNITLRRNRQEIIANGWIHDQYNDKLIREAGKDDVLLAQEKGYNTYLRVDDSKGKVALEYWDKHASLWQNIRDVWEDIYSRNEDLELAKTKEGKRLYEYLFGMDANTPKSDVEAAIHSFLK